MIIQISNVRKLNISFTISNNKIFQILMNYIIYLLTLSNYCSICIMTDLFSNFLLLAYIKPGLGNIDYASSGMRWVKGLYRKNCLYIY